MIKTVRVTIVVDVTLDETKFDPEFMAEFRESFYDFDTIDDHIEHLAQMNARGLYDTGDFIEGYGPTKEMGISFNNPRNRIETEIIEK